jgi:type I restriction enzyme S subunit
MTELPKGWALATVDELSALGGVTDGPFGSNLKTEHYTEAGPRVVRLQNIGDGRFVDERAHIDEAHFERLTKHEVVEGDVLVASLGEVLPRACLAPASLGPAIVKADCIRVRPHSELSATYLMWALNSPDVRASVGSSIKGVGRPRINLGDLRRLQLPVAPAAEQERIVTAIEEAFSKLDAGEAGLRTVRQLLRRMRDAILTAAATGRLVPQDPTNTPAAKLLADLGVEQALGMYEVPDSWAWTRLGAMLQEPMRNGMSAVKADSSEGLPTFSITAVTTGDFSDKNIKYTAGDWNRASDLWAEAGDLFVQRSNTPELVGTARLYRGTPRAAIFPDLLIRVRAVPQLRPEWLELFMGSPRCRAFVRSQAKGLAGSMPKISQPVLDRLEVPVPPEGEQDRIVTEVERQISFVEACERAVDVGLARSAGLRRSVLKAAFEGRLVPQDPSDEPASVLLDRIRAERAAHPVAKRRAGQTA